MSPRQPVVSGERLIKALRKEGWEVVRQRGSHVRLKKIGRRHALVVPLHRELRRGTLVIRGLARRLGVPVYREPIGNEPGGVETLGTLLRAISPAFTNAGLHAYFVVLLVDPLGLNFRNKIAHGLVGKVQKPATALLLQVACVLSSFQLGTPAEEPSPPPGAETVEEAD